MFTKVAVIGGNGYTGFELCKILLQHKNVKICSVVSRSNAGTKITNLFPQLSQFCDMQFCDVDFEVLKECDAAFLCLPHGAAAEIGGKLFDLGLKIIDLSADFRYENIDIYEEIYKVEHPRKDLITQAVYGLPELNKDKIKNAKIVGNPGCYTTCSILPLFPLLKNKLILPEKIIIDAKSGVSGAGKKAELAYSFCELNQNFKAYALTTHRHCSEIEEKLSLAAGKSVQVSFAPHLLPVQRGILSTIYADTAASGEQIYNCYKEFYTNAPFVRIHKEGTLPELNWSVNSNFIDIGFVLDKRLGRIIIVSALDNLIKGASGQAVQNFNLMFGYNEREGLN